MSPRSRPAAVWLTPGVGRHRHRQPPRRRRPRDPHRAAAQPAHLHPRRARRRARASSKASPTGSPAPPASAAAPSPTTPTAGARRRRRLHHHRRALGGHRRRHRGLAGRASCAPAAWTARGLRVPARNALLADVVPATAYGRAYGFERAMDNLGAILGPLLAIGLVAAVGTRWAIGLSVIPGLLAAARHRLRHPPHPAARHGANGNRCGSRSGPSSSAASAACSPGSPPSSSATAPPPCSSCAPPNCSNPAAATTAPPPLALASTSPTTSPPPSPASPPAAHSDRRGADPRARRSASPPSPLAYLGFAATPPAGSRCALVPRSPASASAASRPPNTPPSPPTPRPTPRLRVRAARRHPELGNLAASAIAGILWTAASPTWAFAYLAGWMLPRPRRPRHDPASRPHKIHGPPPQATQHRLTRRDRRGQGVRGQLVEPDRSGGRLVAVDQRPLPPADVVPGAVLPPDRPVHAHRGEAHRLVQARAGRVGQGGPGHRLPVALGGEHGEQRGVQAAPDVPAAGRRRDVHADLDRPVVRGAAGERVRRRRSRPRRAGPPRPATGAPANAR